ncbi:MAG: M15 family peptidase [Pedobacter sp.]|nr:MAG: M15 family peptidase [Pedobacter sp.]
MDSVSLERIKSLHPKLRDEAKVILEEVEKTLTGKAMCRFTFTLRSWEEQDGLYALGRTKANPDGKTAKKPLGNIVTNAKAGDSFHNYGLAVDIALVIDTDGDGKYDKGSWDTKGDYDQDKKADWMEVVAIFKKHGWEWGGDWTSFKDMPHFQKAFGHTLKDLKAKYAKKDFIPGTTYLNL